MVPLIMTLLIAVAVVLVLHRGRSAGTGFVRAAQVGRFWRQRPDYTQRDHRPAAQRTDFTAVSIHCSPESCRAARRLQGKRGFPNQIPRLPLSQCDKESCSCGYVRHEDRRKGDERRNAYAYLITATGPEAQERRLCNDRRADALEDDLQAFNFK